ncbi:hypothetical protein ACCT14_10150 [Rhizobium brockwellii]|uniref:hypothetical protein n=1 Tax=Rhizobium brockwellii TaxID=3019932 RepID=UPI003F9DA0C6
MHIETGSILGLLYSHYSSGARSEGMAKSDALPFDDYSPGGGFGPWARTASDQEARSRAQQKIDDAKEQLDFLKRAGFPPEVIARLAGELARSIGNAANELSRNIGAKGSASETPSVASPVNSIEGPQIAALSRYNGDAEVSDGSILGASSVEERQAKQAYESVIAEAGSGSGSDGENEKIKDELEALLAQANAIKNAAERDSRATQALAR